MVHAPEQLRSAVRSLVGWSDGPGRTYHVSQRVGPGPDRREELWLEGNPPVPATLLMPEGPGPHPAILYCHAHGGDYDLGRRELMEGARWLDRPLGPEFVKAGFAVLAIDAIGFGDRRDDGWTESAAAKSLFWNGQSLFGAMLDELRDALGYLASRPEVDPQRIYTFGVSMGAAHAWWLAALDERVAGCGHAAMLADIAGLLRGAVHDRHGLYYVVPGLLRVCEQGDVAGLVAPRPQIVAHGGADGLTPEGARKAALARLSHAYANCRDMLDMVFVPDAGHELTLEMREAVVGFLTWHARNKEKTL